MNQSINQSRRAKEARGNPRARRRAPSRPRAFPPPPRVWSPRAKPRRRETPTTRARAHRRVPPSRGRRRDPRCAAEIQSSSCTHASNRSIALVSGPSHLFHARASYSCSCSYVPCVHFLVDQTCRRRRASRCAPVACIRGRRRDGTGGRVIASRAVFRCLMRGIRASIGRWSRLNW